MIFLSSPAMTIWNICVSIIANNTEDAIHKIKIAEEVADIVEIRLDSMSQFDLSKIIKASSLPLLVTYRHPNEGGFNKFIKDNERARVLEEAIRLNVDYVDIELEMDSEIRKRLIDKKKETQIIISKHFFSPVSEKILYEYADKIFVSGADIGKLIGYAEKWQDNILFLKLVEEYTNKGYKIISFAMGPYGRPSRVISPIIGSVWTYASLKKEEKTASGQIEASSLRRIWEEISCGD